MTDTKKTPEFNVFIVNEQKGKDTFYKVGAVWKNNNKDGYSGESLYGRIVLLPFEDNADN